MREWTNADILYYGQRKANEQGESLTPVIGTVYILLVELFKREARYDQKKKAYYVQYSASEFANLLQVDKRSFQHAIKTLEKYGLVTYIRPKDFEEDGPQEPNNRSNLTYMDLSVFNIL